jgi:NADH-quinone oxidoreductase subunit G
LGSNLAVHVKDHQVLRVLPVENEDINECWLSDKDRFSYEGLNSAERLTRPMLKQNGKWQEVEWQVALDYTANALSQVANCAGPAEIGALATPHSTLEELYLLQKLTRGLGSGNVDFRLRQSDFSADGKRAGAPWLGMPVAEIGTRDRLLIVGSFLRKDHPLIAQRIRQAVKKGAQASIVHSADDDLLMKVANKAVVAPDAMVNMLAQVLKALAVEKKANVDAAVQGVEASGAAIAIARSLAGGERVAVLLGNFAQQHPQAAQLQLLAQKIAVLCGGKSGFLGEAANSVGGYFANALPGAEGMNAAAMLAAPRKAYILLHAEPELDCANAHQAQSAMYAADLVVALSAYKHQAVDYANVLLPVAPFTETSGTFVSTEGRVQSFKGAVRPLGDARPAWKVLRVLGNLLGKRGFDHDSSEAVRDEALAGVDVPAKLDNTLNMALQSPILSPQPSVLAALQRVAEVPIHSADAIVRRAAALQRTRDAAAPAAAMRGEELKKMGVPPGGTVKVSQGGSSVLLAAAEDNGLPAGVARIPAGHAATAGLGAMFGNVTVERA